MEQTPQKLQNRNGTVSYQDKKNLADKLSLNFGGSAREGNLLQARYNAAVNAAGLRMGVRGVVGAPERTSYDAGYNSKGFGIGAQGPIADPSQGQITGRVGYGPFSINGRAPMQNIGAGDLNFGYAPFKGAKISAGMNESGPRFNLNFKRRF